MTDKLQLPQLQSISTLLHISSYSDLRHPPKAFYPNFPAQCFPSVCEATIRSVCYTWLVRKSQAYNKNKPKQLRIKFYKLQMSPWSEDAPVCGVLSEANRTMRSFRISFCVCVIRRYSSRWRKVVRVHDNKGGKGDLSTLFCHLTNQHAFMSQTLLNLKNRVGSFLAAAHPGQPQELSQQKIN